MGSALHCYSRVGRAYDERCPHRYLHRPLACGARHPSSLLRGVRLLDFFFLLFFLPFTKFLERASILLR